MIKLFKNVFWFKPYPAIGIMVNSKKKAVAYNIIAFILSVVIVGFIIWKIK